MSASVHACLFVFVAVCVFTYRLENKYSKIDAKLADVCRMADSKRSEFGGTQGSVFDDPGAIRMFSVRCIWEPAFCLGYDRLIVHCLEAFTTGHTGRDLVRFFILFYV